jgi:hypothetical protein
MEIGRTSPFPKKGPFVDQLSFLSKGVPPFTLHGTESDTIGHPVARGISYSGLE